VVGGYGWFTAPSGRDEVEIVSGCGGIMIVIVSDFCTACSGDDESSNLNIGVVVPGAVGVPVIVPPVASKKRPAGRAGEPLARLHV
jgi:hypothetical protein